MFGWLKRGPKEDWRLVASHKTTAIHLTKLPGEETQKKKVDVFIHHYESSKGNRKFDATCVKPMDNILESIQCLLYYHEVVYPWLHGAYDPGIPSYSDMDMLNLQAKLGQ